METTRILYHELFTIRFLHDGFNAAHSSFIGDSINIIPDEETADIIRNLGIGCRFLGDSFVCFIRSKRVTPPANQPMRPVIDNKAETRLRFLVSALPDFINKTFIAHAGGKLVYHFSNRINNIDNTPPAKVFLNKTIQAFNTASDYLAGTIVGDATDVYGARKSINHADNIAISNGDFWQDVGNQGDQFVNNADLEKVVDVNASEKCFAVIDIFNTGTVNGYDLFNTAGELLSPVYTISLKSRI